MTVEILLSEANLTAALKNVQKKKKSPGIDKMRTRELSAFWELHREEIIVKIRLGAYKPQPTLAVSIPKNSGNGTRNLEIPCVLDRMIQSAMYTALSPFYEKNSAKKVLVSGICWEQRMPCRPVLMAWISPL